MYDILMAECPSLFSVINQVKDEIKKKELRSDDDEEDYLDEGLFFFVSNRFTFLNGL